MKKMANNPRIGGFRKRIRGLRKEGFQVFCLILCVSLLFSGCTGISRVGKKKAEVAEAPPPRGQAVEVERGGRNVIRSIDFIGNHTYKDKKLKDKVGFEVGDYLDPVLAETGRGIISELYRKNGFPHVSVIINAAKVETGELIYIIDEGPRVRIRSVKFQGNSGIKTSSLKKAVKTGTRKWVVKPVYYTEEMVTADVERLQKIYYSRGYLNSKVRATGDSHITFIINEGPLYKVGDIVITGNTRFGSATLLSGFKLEPGDTYAYQKADLQAEEMLKLYRENGYVNSQVTQRPAFVESGEGNIADVVFTIGEGRQFRIGRVDITGNETTQDKVIRHVLDEYDFTPGSLYNAHTAPNEPGGQLEKYIQRMTLAEQAIIMPLPFPGDPNRLDARVDITEGLTGMWNPGVGIGSDSGVIGHLVFQQRNFDITDTPDSFGDFIGMKSFRGAGQTLRIALEPGTEVSQYSISFTEPYFRDKPTSLDVAGSFYERERESYDEERMKAYLGFEQRREENWRRSIGFRAENVDVGGIDVDAPKEINKVKGGNVKTRTKGSSSHQSCSAQAKKAKPSSLASLTTVVSAIQWCFSSRICRGTQSRSVPRRWSTITR